MTQDPVVGPAWAQVLALPRTPVADLDGRGIPTSPGIYAWFQDGQPIYAGKASGADGLRGRLRNHLGRGQDLSRSSLRRNVAEHLLGVPTSVSRARPSLMTTAQVSAVNEWIERLEVSWLEFSTAREAEDFERTLLREWMPSLSKR